MRNFSICLVVFGLTNILLQVNLKDTQNPHSPAAKCYLKDTIGQMSTLNLEDALSYSKPTSSCKYMT